MSFLCRTVPFNCPPQTLYSLPPAPDLLGPGLQLSAQKLYLLVLGPREALRGLVPGPVLACLVHLEGVQIHV
jgi:hypothetical protein